MPLTDYTPEVIALRKALKQDRISLSAAAARLHITLATLSEAVCCTGIDARLEARIEAEIFGYRHAIFSTSAELRRRRHAVLVLGFDPACAVTSELRAALLRFGLRRDSGTLRAELVKNLLDYAARMRPPIQPIPKKDPDPL